MDAFLFSGSNIVHILPFSFHWILYIALCYPLNNIASSTKSCVQSISASPHQCHGKMIRVKAESVINCRTCQYEKKMKGWIAAISSLAPYKSWERFQLDGFKYRISRNLLHVDTCSKYSWQGLCNNTHIHWADSVVQIQWAWILIYTLFPEVLSLQSAILTDKNFR